MNYENTILLTFNFFNSPSVTDIVNYCNRFQYHEEKKIKKEIKKLIKYEWLTNVSITYEGEYILNNLNRYYTCLIKNFFINIKKRKIFPKRWFYNKTHNFRYEF